MATPEVLPHQLRPGKQDSLGGARRYLILITACCGTFVGFGSVVIFTFGVFLKPLTSAFGWTRSQVSLAFTLAALTVAICSPLIGRLLDRFPARRVIIPCTIVYAVAFASLGLLTGRLSHLLATFVLMGVIGNATTQLGYARVVSAWFHEARGRALAVVMAGSAAGSMILPPFAQALISRFGWRGAYGILGGMILVLGVPLTAAFLHEPEQKIETAEPGLRIGGHSVWDDLRSRTFLALSAALVLFSLATNGLEAHLPAMLTDRGFGPEQAAGVLSMAGVATLASRVATGYFLDRFVASRVAAVLFMVCAGGFSLLIYAKSLPLALSGAALVGIGLGAESDTVPYLLTRFFGLSRFSELYAYTWSAYAVAASAGPFVMAQTFDYTGSYQVALVIFTGLVIAAALLFAFLPSYRLDRSPT